MTQEPEIQKPGILVVDDEQIVRDLITKFLAKLGYNVEEAVDGPEAVAVFEELDEKPILVITDIVMPDMSGYELADKLRELEPDLGILFISSDPDNLSKEHKENPKSRSLGKPFSLSALANSVKALL